MNLSDAVFCVVDIESTGLNPETDRIVESACVATTAKEVLGMWASLVDGRPCNAETSAIHGLVDGDLDGAPEWVEARRRWGEFVDRIRSGNGGYIAAHNSAFDKSFVEPQGFDAWLCTKRLSGHLWPDAPSHKNQVLRYWRNLQVDTFGVLPHRALADCLVTAALLRDELSFMSADLDPKWLEIETDDQLVAFANSPITVTKWPFGKHFGNPISSAPASYVDWCLKLPDLDPDLRWTLENLAVRK